jgi:hypothetical protein
MGLVDMKPFDQIMRDMYSSNPPEWVLKARAERKELEISGRRVSVPGHDDNTGMNCRNVGPATLIQDMFDHDCCYVCCDRAESIMVSEGLTVAMPEDGETPA